MDQFESATAWVVLSNRLLQWIGKFGCLLSSRCCRRTPLQPGSSASDVMLSVIFGACLPPKQSVVQLNWAPGSGFSAHPQPIAE